MTTADPYGPDVALDWSVMAMNDATDRVNKIAESNLPHTFAAIGEAVWWITIINDSLRHNHRTAYDRAIELTMPSPAATLLGLRSVRNCVGHEVDLVDFVQPIASRPDPGDGRITAWAWSHVRPPTPERRTKREYEGALRCHQAYEAAVVEDGQGGNIVYTFGLVTGFLRLAHERRLDETGA
jgi:hypothetical protein